MEHLDLQAAIGPFEIKDRRDDLELPLQSSSMRRFSASMTANGLRHNTGIYLRVTGTRHFVKRAYPDLQVFSPAGSVTRGYYLPVPR